MADRLASMPNSKDYAAVTVIIQALTKVEKLIQVKRTAFYPAPNVDSTVIKLTKHQHSDIKDFNRFDALVKAAFKQKRKTLLNNLSLFVDKPKEEILESLKQIDDKYDNYTRAESLTIEDFIRLSNRWFI